MAYVWADRLRSGWALTVAQDEPAPETDEALRRLDDRALAEACLRGRSEAFEVIVDRHRRTVYRLCYRFSGNPEDAGDLSQEVFLRAYRGLATFKAQSSFSTWLYRIGVNVCLNRPNRSSCRETALTEQPVDDQSLSPVEAVLASERAAIVRAAIARLPKTQRATLILRVYHELSHREIADVLKSSPGTVKVNFFHALSNLRKLLSET